MSRVPFTRRRMTRVRGTASDRLSKTCSLCSPVKRSTTLRKIRVFRCRRKPPLRTCRRTVGDRTIHSPQRNWCTSSGHRIMRKRGVIRHSGDLSNLLNQAVHWRCVFSANRRPPFDQENDEAGHQPVWMGSGDQRFDSRRISSFWLNPQLRDGATARGTTRGPPAGAAFPSTRQSCK